MGYRWTVQIVLDAAVDRVGRGMGKRKQEGAVILRGAISMAQKILRENDQRVA